MNELGISHARLHTSYGATIVGSVFFLLHLELARVPDVVETVRVSLDRGRVGVVERFCQHFGCVVPQRSVDVVGFGQRGVTVGDLGRTADIVATVERRLTLGLVVALGEILGWQ